MKSVKDAGCLLQRARSRHRLAGKEINDCSASALMAAGRSYPFSSQLDSSCFSHSVKKRNKKKTKPHTQAKHKPQKTPKQKPSKKRKNKKQENPPCSSWPRHHKSGEKHLYWGISSPCQAENLDAFDKISIFSQHNFQIFNLKHQDLCSTLYTDLTPLLSTVESRSPHVEGSPTRSVPGPLSSMKYIQFNINKMSHLFTACVPH